MLIWIFGSVKKNTVHILENNKASGYLELERARIKWYLSLDRNDIPAEVQKVGGRTYRSITIDEEEIEFSGGFTDLHTESYRQILKGNHFPLLDAKPAIDAVYTIRNAKPQGRKGEYHPMAFKN